MYIPTVVEALLLIIIVVLSVLAVRTDMLLARIAERLDNMVQWKEYHDH